MIDTVVIIIVALLVLSGFILMCIDLGMEFFSSDKDSPPNDSCCSDEWSDLIDRVRDDISEEMEVAYVRMKESILENDIDRAKLMAGSLIAFEESINIIRNNTKHFDCKHDRLKG